MRPIVLLLLAGLSLSAPAFAQGNCTPDALPTAARQIAALRHQLHTVAVPENDPQVPAAVADQLQSLKAALNTAADAAFACAKPDASPEDLEATLASALHANLSQAAATTIVTRDKRDEGAFGSDLAVQIFPLFSSPRYVEVNFRFGIECGDDNVLLVYRVTDGQWRAVLRWSAPTYANVGGAYGDFVLLTPLSGFQGDRNWRFVVAHGEPQCTAETAPSHFDLDLLQPTADPAQPQVVWHLQQPYTRNAVPRLSTTEDTLTFQLTPAAKGKTPAQPEVYRFSVSKDNQVSPLAADLPPAQAAASTSSPR